MRRAAPLSVSSDRIAVTAMRCAGLLAALAERRGLGRALDRIGADRVVEVYPGAALPPWSDEAGDTGFRSVQPAHGQMR